MIRIELELAPPSPCSFSANLVINDQRVFHLESSGYNDQYGQEKNPEFVQRWRKHAADLGLPFEMTEGAEAAINIETGDPKWANSVAYFRKHWGTESASTAESQRA